MRKILFNCATTAFLLQVSLPALGDATGGFDSIQKSSIKHEQSLSANDRIYLSNKKASERAKKNINNASNQTQEEAWRKLEQNVQYTPYYKDYKEKYGNKIPSDGYKDQIKAQNPYGSVERKMSTDSSSSSTTEKWRELEQNVQYTQYYKDYKEKYGNKIPGDAYKDQIKAQNPYADRSKNSGAGSLQVVESDKNKINPVKNFATSTGDKSIISTEYLQKSEFTPNTDSSSNTASSNESVVIQLNNTKLNLRSVGENSNDPLTISKTYGSGTRLILDSDFLKEKNGKSNLTKEETESLIKIGNSNLDRKFQNSEGDIGVDQFLKVKILDKENHVIDSGFMGLTAAKNRLSFSEAKTEAEFCQACKNAEKGIVEQIKGMDAISSQAADTTSVYDDYVNFFENKYKGKIFQYNLQSKVDFLKSLIGNLGAHKASRIVTALTLQCETGNSKGYYPTKDKRLAQLAAVGKVIENRSETTFRSTYKDTTFKAANFKMPIEEEVYGTETKAYARMHEIFADSQFSCWNQKFMHLAIPPNWTNKSSYKNELKEAFQVEQMLSSKQIDFAGGLEDRITRGYFNPSAAHPNWDDPKKRLHNPVVIFKSGEFAGQQISINERPHRFMRGVN